jgi:MerR family transcriptional regulator, light-induced transcriptional regulator
MDQKHLQAAEILKASASGYANEAAERLLASHPALEARYGAGARALWRAHFKQRLGELTAALLTEQPALFEARVTWLRRAYLAQGAAEDDHRLALEALRATLESELPDALRETAGAYLARAIASLRSELAPERCELDPHTPAGRLTLEYLAQCLEGQPRAAMDLVIGAAEQGWALPSLYTDVLLPAEKEIGRMWHAGEALIAEERVVSETTRRLMAVLSQRSAPPRAEARTLVAASVAGNEHDIALRAAADLFQFAGWRSTFLGADVPAAQIAAGVQIFRAEVALLSATMAVHVEPLQASIDAIRAGSAGAVKIIVGGQLFVEAPDFWRQTGADACAGTLTEVVEVGERLTA